MRLLPLLLLTLFIAATRGQAEDARPNSVPGHEEVRAEFQRLDRDRDGRVSRMEFVNAAPERKRGWRNGERSTGGTTERDMARPEVFSSLDVNHDGLLSEEELARAQTSQNVHGRLNRDGAQGNEPEPPRDDHDPNRDK